MTTLEAIDTSKAEDLRGFVRDHEVCWETIVHRDVGPRGVASVGYDVVLLARCRERPCDPGGSGALALFAGLAQLAGAVIPDRHADDIRIAAFEPAFRLRAQGDWQPEMQLVIEIRHDHDYFDAIDDDERTCVRGLERALAEWGVQHEAWSRKK